MLPTWVKTGEWLKNSLFLIQDLGDPIFFSPSYCSVSSVYCDTSSNSSGMKVYITVDKYFSFQCRANSCTSSHIIYNWPISPKDNTSQRFVFQQISFLQPWIRNVVKTSRSGKAAGEEQDSLGVSLSDWQSSVSLLHCVLCTPSLPSSSSSPPVVISSDY